MNANVVNLFERKAVKTLNEMTPEQRLKLFTIQEMMGTENAAEILQHITVDEAFKFLAEQAVEVGNMNIDPKLTHETQKPASEGLHSYTPEMKENKPNCQIEASLSYYGNHYFLRTRLELKGRGVSLVDYDDDGINKYKVTILAFEKLQQVYSISMERLLD